MSLADFAQIVGATPRWVVNALQVLGRRRDYSFATARDLRLARILNQQMGIGLKRAWSIAGRILDEPGVLTAWTFSDPASGVSLGVDRERFLSSLACGLSASRVWRRADGRGRPAAPRSLERRLQDSATDLTALMESVALPLEERLERIDAAFELVATERHTDPSLAAILTRLVKARVGFVIHGPMAAALHGALAIPTVVDIRPDPDDANLQRLARVMRELGATLRGVGPGLPLLLDEITFSSEPVVPLETRHGSITVHQRIPDLTNPESTAPVHRVTHEEGEFLLLGIGSLHESLSGRGLADADEVATQLEAVMELGLER